MIVFLEVTGWLVLFATAAVLAYSITKYRQSS